MSIGAKSGWRTVRALTFVAGAAITLMALSACDPGSTSVLTTDTTTFAKAGAIAMIPGGGEYVVDPSDCVIRKIDDAGAVTTFAGTGTCGFSGDGGPATAAKINPGDPTFLAATGHVAVDSQGNVYLADSGNGRIRKIDTNGTITTIAGDGSTYVPGSGQNIACSGVNADAVGITVTPDGTVYVACLAGIGKVMPDGTLSQVLTANPSALTSDAAGNLYFSDYYGEQIKKFDPTTSTTTLVSDFSSLALYGPGTTGVVVTDLAVGADGTVFAAFGPITFMKDCFAAFYACGTYYVTNLNFVARIENGAPLRIAGNGAADPATTAQAGYGRDLALSPYGIGVTHAGALLISSGHSIYRLDDAAHATPYSGSDCSSAFHSGASFAGQDLSGMDLHRCNLSFIDFTGANLTGANLADTTIWSGNFTGANLTGVNLTNTDISGSTLTNMVLNGATLANTRGTTVVGAPAAMPTGYGIRASTLVGPGIDLSNTTLTNLDFSGLDLSGANLSGAQVAGTSFANSDLHGAKLARLQASCSATNPVTDFTNADLSNADISGQTSLCGLLMTGANLDGADLSGLRTNGGSLTSGGIVGSPLHDVAWRVINGYLVGTYADLQGVNLSNADLSSMSISYANFTGATLTNANLTGTALSNCNFTGANLTGAVLDSARLRGDNLSNANFSGASAVGIYSTELSGTAASSLPTGISYPHNAVSVLVGPGVDLDATMLIGLDLSGLDLSGANLNNALLRDANVTGTKFAGASFTKLTNFNLSGTATSLPTSWKQAGNVFIGPTAQIPSANLSGVDLTNQDLSGASLSTVTFTNVNLSGANFTNTSISQSSLTNVDIHGATVQGASFSGTTVTGGLHAHDLLGNVVAPPTNWAQRGTRLLGPGEFLTGAELSGMDLSNLDLDAADLSGANLTNANLSGTSINSANVQGTDFTGTNLTGLWGSTVSGTPAALPTDWRVVAQTFLGPGARVRQANLTGANLAGINLSNASITTQLPNADLSGANLSGANLYTSDLTGANLSGANLTHSNLSGVYLAGATLDGVTSSGIVGTPTSLPTGWKLIGGSLIGKGAVAPGVNLGFQDLTGMDLSGADLSGANMSYTNVTGANLTGTNLSGANLNRLKARQIIGIPMNIPVGWTARSGFLFGPTANLMNADLTGIDLSGLILTNTRLDAALLGGANLTNTTFAGSTGVPTSGTSAIYANTTCPDATVATSPATCVGHGFDP